MSVTTGKNRGTVLCPRHGRSTNVVFNVTTDPDDPDAEKWTSKELCCRCYFEVLTELTKERMIGKEEEV